MKARLPADGEEFFAAFVPSDCAVRRNLQILPQCLVGKVGHHAAPPAKDVGRPILRSRVPGSGLRVLLEKLDDEGRSRGWVLMRAGMDKRHDRRANFRWIQGAVFFVFPRLTGSALIQLTQPADHHLLPGELDQRVVGAGDMKDGPGFELREVSGGDRSGGGKRSKAVPARRPEQVGEAAAI